jgi:hypothetical protein
MATWSREGVSTMKKEEIRIRTAKTDFKDSCGEEIRKGETFIIVEARPQFYSRPWLKKAIEALDQDAEKEEGGE